jgi:hypothetical protein
LAAVGRWRPLLGDRRHVRAHQPYRNRACGDVRAA